MIKLDYDEVEAIIFEWIEKSTCPRAGDAGASQHWDWDPTISDCIWFPNRRGSRPLGPRLIRQAFHDATGISDGFIDLTDPENAGLESSDHVLNLIYSNTTFTFTDSEIISEVLNKADFAAWSYIAALRFTASLQNGQGGGVPIVPDIPITFGRWTLNGTQPIENLPLRSGHSTGMDVATYFSEVFNFNEEEAATIMGAHTLGGAEPTESGHRGHWTGHRDVFDIEYYRNIITAPSGGPPNGQGAPQGTPSMWEVKEIVSAMGRKFQWSHSCNADGTGCMQLMLHADMALFKDIDAFICTTDDAATGMSGCEADGQVRQRIIRMRRNYNDLGAPLTPLLCVLTRIDLGVS
jgi:hypothetical protein